MTRFKADDIQVGDSIRFRVPTRDGTKRGPRKVRRVLTDGEHVRSVEVWLNGWSSFRIKPYEITAINERWLDE